MKTNRTIAGWLMLLALLSTLNSQLSTAFAQGTAFTYQGRLNAGGNPTTGLYDLKFTLFDSLTGGGLGGGIVGGPLTISATGVTNGLFCVTLDFGSGVFTGPNRWLEIAARTNGAASFTTLAPRQQLTPAPYAVYAESANAAALSGTIPLAQLPGAVVTNNNAASANLSGSFTGNGSGLTALDAGNIASGTLDDARLPANVALLNADQTFSGYNIFNLPLGIGVAPAWPLDVQAVQAVGRFTSTYSYFGSVIELQNTSGAGAYMLGAINFNDAYGYYPGQIGYLTSDVMSFRVGGVDNMMWLDLSGLEVQGGLNVHGELDVENNLVCNNLYLSSAAIYFGGTPFIHADGSQNFSAGIGAGNFMSGGNNTAVGYQALLNNTSGSFNTANGCQALTSNTNGNNNTAIGEEALRNNTTGNDNTAIGLNALMLNTNGSYNTAIGQMALWNNTSGSNNIALGYQAGFNLTTGSSNIDIGNQGFSSDTNLIRIGDGQTQTFIAGIIYGNGGGLTNLNAGNVSSGIVPLARLSGITGNQLDAAAWQQATNLNGGKAALASNVVSGIAITNAFITNSVFAGNGGGLTNLNASQLAGGTVPTSILPGFQGINYQTVGGGSNNVASGQYATVGGGSGNVASSSSATVAGGQNNTANNTYATVGGGYNNSAGYVATIPGGANNLASGYYSFAAGQRAKATNQGAFVWADSQGADFSSTNNDQFLIRAQGGVGIGTNVTAGNALTVAGNVAATSFSGNGSGLMNIPGTLLAVNTLPVSGGNVANAPAITWTKVADLGSFTKQNGTMLELTFNGRLVVGSWAGGTGGADFELRLDNTASSVGRVRATVMSTDNANFGIQAGMTGFFTGYNAGSHTVSMWVYSYAGGITNIAVNPGYYSATHVAIKEFK